jgi:hypothetical protein
MSIADDPEIQATRRAVTDASRALAEARAARARFRPATSGLAILELDILQMDAVIRRAEAALGEAEHRHTAATDAAQRRLAASRRPGRHQHLRRLLDATQAAIGVATELVAYDAETGEQLGRPPEPHPLPQLFGLDLALARIERELAGPLPPEPVPPPRPGYVRLRARTKVLDPDAGLGIWRYPGDRFDVPESVAREAIRNAVASAEPV